VLVSPGFLFVLHPSAALARIIHLSEDNAFEKANIDHYMRLPIFRESHAAVGLERSDETD